MKNPGADLAILMVGNDLAILALLTAPPLRFSYGGEDRCRGHLIETSNMISPIKNLHQNQTIL